MDDKKYPRFISNKPSGKDLFDGKSQEKIAESIASHITDPNTETKLIGIDGEWGSGKSNVIGILQEQLKETHHVYIYDAWGHQEDLQRKSFLEELTSELIREKLLSEKATHKDFTGEKYEFTWSEKLKFLLSRKKETEKKDVPKLSIGMLIISLIIILTPVMTIIADYLGDNIENTKDSLIFKLLISFSLIGVGLIFIIIYSFIRLFKKNLAHPASFIYVYQGNVLNTTTFETISDAEPSVTEFKQWMRELSDDLNKGVVIVFDNMDRLPPVKIKEFWSSIHTFFAEGDVYENIWVIVPFDRNHLRKSFNTEDPDIADQFLNKTFSLIYRISPPILTDWKNFFSQVFRDAFGGTENTEKLIMSIFDILKPRFTPRDIIAFINELVSLKNIWGDSISLKYIALYCLKKNDLIENPRSEILAGAYAEKVKKYFSQSDELQKNIAAITFNVPLEKAHQVVLHRELELVIRGENLESINNIAKHTHFIDILEDVVTNSEFELIPAVMELSKLDIKLIAKKDIEERIVAIWDILCGIQLHSKLSAQDFSNIHEQLLLNCSPNTQKVLVDYLCNQFIIFSSFSGSAYYIALATLQRIVNENSIAVNVEELLSDKEVTPEIFIDYIDVAKGKYKQFKIYCGLETFDDHCANLIPKDFVDPKLLGILQEDQQYDFEKTRKAISGAFKEDTITVENYFNILETQKAISKEKPFSDLLSVEQLYTLLSSIESKDTGYADLIAMRLILGSDYDTYLSTIGEADSTVTALSGNPEALVGTISEQIENYTDYGDLIELVTEWKQPLLIAVVEELTRNSYGTSRLSILSALSVYKELIFVLNIESSVILKKFSDWTSYCCEKLTVENFEKIISIELIADSLVNKEPLTDYIIKLAKNFVKNPDSIDLTEEWGNDASYYYSVLHILMKSNKIRALPANVFKVIKYMFKDIVTSVKEIPKENTLWIYFMDKAAIEKIQPTIKNIRDEYINRVEITPDSFLFFASFLEKYGDLGSHAGDVTRTILEKVIDDSDCLDHIVSQSKIYIPIIGAAGDDAFDFKETLEEILKNDLENDELINFASKVGVELAIVEVED